MDKKLRNMLSKIVISSGTGRYRRWYTPGLFEKHVAPLLPVSIKVIAPPPQKKDNYNCFIYALGLQKNSGIIRSSKGFIYSAFVQKILDAREVEIVQTPAADDIVLYRNPKRFGKEFTHAGVIQKDGTVISKWSWGPLLHHSLFDVPELYGSEITYLRAVSPKNSVEL